MKKFLPIILCAVCLYACDNTIKFSNADQAHFDNILSVNFEKIKTAPNDAAKEAVYAAYEKEMVQFIDSIKIINAFRGKIKSIKLNNNVLSNSYKDLTFEIFYESGKEKKTTFASSVVIKSDSLDANSIYKSINSLPNNSDVYFTGIIKRKKDGTIAYKSGLTSSPYFMISNPTFEFFPVCVSTVEGDCRLSSSFMSIVSIDYGAIMVMNQEIKGDVPKNAFSEYVNAHKGGIDRLLSNLSPEEKEYRNNLFNYLMNQK